MSPHASPHLNTSPYISQVHAYSRKGSAQQAEHFTLTLTQP